MRQFALVGLVLVIVLGGARAASAQTCSGLPAIGQNSKGNIGGLLAIGNRQLPVIADTSNTVGVGASVTYGSERTYGTFVIGKNNYTLFQYTTTIVGFTLGGQVNVGKDRPFSICPFGKASGEWAGALNDNGLSFTTDVVAGGANVGFKIGSSDRREMMPTIGMSVERVRDTASDPGNKITEKNIVGVLTLGMGFIFDKRIALRPAVSYPIGLPSAHVTVSLIATAAYGRR